MPRVFFKPASEEPTASICWLPHEPHLLAVGTSISWVRIYDTRMGGAGAECLAIMAHTATRPRKVKGIRPDPLQQHIIATFSDSAGEPIKIWDLRKSGPSAKPKLTIVQPAVSAVLDAEWSSARAGAYQQILRQLSVAFGPWRSSYLNA
jgi:WD40 repeat protein